jgi:hypothetical protein
MPPQLKKVKQDLPCEFRWNANWTAQLYPQTNPWMLNPRRTITTHTQFPIAHHNILAGDLHFPIAWAAVFWCFILNITQGQPNNPNPLVIMAPVLNQQ